MRLRIQRYLDRVTDRRPVVRITRASYRKRRSPWRLLLLLVLTVLLIAVLLAWWQSSQDAPSGRVVEISASPSDGLFLDGEPVSLTEMESRLRALRAGAEPVFASIAPEPFSAGPARPTPEVEALLARLQISWMAMPDTRLRPRDKGGDHGH